LFHFWKIFRLFAQSRFRRANLDPSVTHNFHWERKMIKRMIVTMLMTLSFAAVAGQMFASVPEPSCFPCPTVAQK
jgi:hypothetical protein